MCIIRLRSNCFSVLIGRMVGLLNLLGVFMCFIDELGMLKYKKKVTKKVDALTVQN